MKTLSDIYYIFWRETKFFFGHKVRVVMSIVQSLIWFIVVGSILNNLTLFIAKSVAVDPTLVNQTIFDNAPDYITYVTSGIIVMTTMLSGFMGGTSVVSDRRMGYLYRLLSAPISRASIPLGKMLSIALQVVLQVAVMILLALFMGVSFKTGILGILFTLLIAAIFGMGISAISLALGARIKSMELLTMVTVAMTLPLMFSSTALFPEESLPNWLHFISMLNPISYVSQAIRSLVYKGWDWNDIMFSGSIVILFTTLSTAWVIFEFKKRII